MRAPANVYHSAMPTTPDMAESLTAIEAWLARYAPRQPSHFAAWPQ